MFSGILCQQLMQSRNTLVRVVTCCMALCSRWQCNIADYISAGIAQKEIFGAVFMAGDMSYTHSLASASHAVITGPTAIKTG